jgi:hypothetical protein
MLSSNLILYSSFGLAQFDLSFFKNKDIYIKEYSPSVAEVFYNPDIRCLTMWSFENGWNRPKPHRDLIDQDVELWRHFWETYLVDSEYLERKFGSRESTELFDDFSGED